MEERQEKSLGLGRDKNRKKQHTRQLRFRRKRNRREMGKQRQKGRRRSQQRMTHGRRYWWDGWLHRELGEQGKGK